MKLFNGIRTSDLVFTESAPLGRFRHRVAISVCGVVGMSAVFLGLSLALRSQDQFQPSHCSFPPRIG